jgi:uncharacterized membrane protein YhaH (DUF805 family)
MSLQPCPECGREVSDKAAACPGCGVPLALSAAGPFDPGAPLAVGELVHLPWSRPAPYSRGALSVKWEREDDPLLGKTGRITEIDPDGTLKLDIDLRGGWFAPTWVSRNPWPHFVVGQVVQLPSSRPAPYSHGAVSVQWEREDDPLLGKTGRITEIDPDGTFKLDIDPRGGWFAPTWTTTSSAIQQPVGGSSRESGNLVSRAFRPSGRFGRGEYAVVYLGAAAIGWVLFTGAFAEAESVPTGPFQLAAVLWLCFQVPLVVCAGIRRVHDLGKPGSFLLWAFVPLVNVFMIFYLLLARGVPEGSTQWG